MRPWFWIERRWSSRCVVSASLRTAVERGGMITRTAGMSLQYLVVHRVAVIGAVGGHRTDRALDLVQQIRERRDIGDIIRGQFNCGDLLRIGVDPQMQFAPAPAGPDPM